MHCDWDRQHAYRTDSAALPVSGRSRIFRRSPGRAVCISSWPTTRFQQKNSRYESRPAMPKTSLISVLWAFFLVIAVVCLVLALAAAGGEPSDAATSVLVFGSYSALIFSMFSAIFSLLGLSFSLNTSIGRPLTLFTALVGTGLGAGSQPRPPLRAAACKRC